MNDNDDFDPPSIATNENLDLLNSCDRFIMIYPEKVVSSCLIELGFAIAQRKPCTIFYKKKEDLPYMLEDAGMIKKFSYKDDDDLIKKIQKIGLKLF
jgi:nucleoside 2-deoxyribosyltransferase